MHMRPPASAVVAVAVAPRACGWREPPTRHRAPARRRSTTVADRDARQDQATTAGTSRASTTRRRLRRPHGAKFKAVTNIGYDKTDVVLRQLAKSGANFIIAHASGYDTVASRIAQQYKVPMMTYDVPTMLVKNYVSNITTPSQEGSYLAGILAAKMTKTHKVGIVISASDPNWYKMSGGFAAGVPQRRQVLEDLLRDDQPDRLRRRRRRQARRRTASSPRAPTCS